jgi:hypothetical protein
MVGLWARLAMWAVANLVLKAEVVFVEDGGQLEQHGCLKMTEQ